MGLNPVPSLHLIQAEADELDRKHFDVHTMNIIINGAHGGWDVALEATDENLRDHRFEYILDRHGWHLERLDQKEHA